MKKSIIAAALCCILILPGCSSMSNLGKGALIGSGSGAAIGAIAGALIGQDGRSAAIGAAIGTAVGGGAGAIIGNAMDKKAEELAAIENAKVEELTDINGLPCIKVTFDSGILFKTNSSTLSAEAKVNIQEFAEKMKDLETTDITVWGHTDNTGTAAVNENLSKKRADAVAKVLNVNGIADARITSEGKSFNLPVADNATVEGRAQNRRVEIYITADEEMIKAAEKAAAAQN